jgi:hypothetical protein
VIRRECPAWTWEGIVWTWCKRIKVTRVCSSNILISVIAAEHFDIAKRLEGTNGVLARKSGVKE